MATYKVIQDVEAEDKLVGPLTLRQFIYAGIAGLSLYLGFLAVSKHAGFMLAIFVPIAGVSGFFAFPWNRDQPTEIWALAKLRFLIKPRKRVWDQSGAKDLVTVTAPKVVEHHLTNGLSENEVRSRLSALANTIDSRGWAVKNVNVNLSGGNYGPGAIQSSDRLVSPESMPQEVNPIEVRASDDILDERANPIAQQFDNMMSAAASKHRQQIMAQMESPAPAQPPQQPAATYAQPSTPPNYWFMQPPPTTPGQAQFLDAPVVTPVTPTGIPAAIPGATPGPQAAAPTPEEEALIAKFKEENSLSTVATSHLKTVKTPEQLAAEAARAKAAAAVAQTKPAVTAQDQAAIINLANNDDLDIATLARQAKREVEDDGEVVISLR